MLPWSIYLHLARNFGIVKHPGSGNPAVTDNSSATGQLDPNAENERARRSSSARNDGSTAEEQLKGKGFIWVQWYGKCEADKVTVGTFPVSKGTGGMYGLVFDNTFSKSFAKTVTLVLLTYPSNAPPQSTHSLGQGALAGIGFGNNVKGQSPRLAAAASDSVDSLPNHLTVGNNRSRGNSLIGANESESNLATHHVGVLQKRRRKKGQGYARRYFSLDFATCTLSYYHDRNSSALRGAIPLSLAAIAADERRREIAIDSGAEVWHLRAGNVKEFQEWTTALERASKAARGVDSERPSSPNRLRPRMSGLQHVPSNQDDDRDWTQVEALVSRIAGTRDAVRRLSKDTAPKVHTTGLGVSLGSPPMDEGSLGEHATPSERKPFWRRKSAAPPPNFAQTQLGVPTPQVVTTVSANGSARPSSRKTNHSSSEEYSMHEHCEALLNDLDSVLADFSTLLTNRKQRRRMSFAPRSADVSRTSMESTSTDEFYDAEQEHSQMLIIGRQSEEDTPASEPEEGLASDTSSVSSVEKDDVSQQVKGEAALFPAKPKNLDPLPIPSAPKRRTQVPIATVMPPSLIGFVRKNVGKDLSTISMPVSANEPLSLLQRVAEQMEYASLLDKAVANKDPIRRLLHVTAFAVSQFSVNRAKERAIRKPFNPMLGETYELIRADNEIPGGFRMLVEKVSHRPVRMATQADSANWSLSQSPAPVQKFWGKSAELITDGRVRIVLRLGDKSEERYSYTVATVFLRNVVMGEKYIEPVANMTVTNESSGAKAVIEFKGKGMFGGRSEDVQVDTYDSNGSQTGVGMTGTWTTSLQLTEAGRSSGEIWHVGDLVENAPQRYGFTTFAASLNEITDIENGKLPVTDCRLRPDQRAAEAGDLDRAETLKATLEDNQRVRRKELEAKGETYRPRWFVKVEGGDEGEEVWKLRTGKEGYWEERARGQWTGVENVLAV
ncbi:Oxysterol-binding protein-domain-containing protein [Xylogone sp. PMI_703]|nr:Oxysterol-binding protein-domain-containing protein [Xylogone sp. PMI_703]